MAVLLLDIGNSRCKAVVFSQGQFQLLASHQAADLSGFNIEQVLCSSVATAARFVEIQQQTGLTHLRWTEIRSEASRHGLQNCYGQPELLGVDRWLAMLGARTLLPAQPLLVIDAGTAITVDWVDAVGQHQGGWILPGLRLLEKSVTSNTAKVFAQDGLPLTLQPGTSTGQCLQNGCLAAAIGALQTAIQQQQVAAVVCTGGDAATLLPFLQSSVPLQLDPLLIFRGLALYLPKITELAKE